jgi:hypothetical protein
LGYWVGWFFLAKNPQNPKFLLKNPLFGQKSTESFCRTFNSKKKRKWEEKTPRNYSSQ